MEMKETQLESMEQISNRNLIIFHAKEFIAVYNGASEYKVLPKGVRDKAIRNGLLTRHYYPSKQRLTKKAINILKRNDLID
ncbi:hypothetical protein GF319_10055 [Candidatus Bathyarchaeota archaeon]|nr:hypothetical protein [Candidatus Bathyarchaeota archaeon]